MSESTSSLVECPVCEAEFDPTAAGGWCTNSECGEWRYEGPDLDADEPDADEPDITEADAEDADADASAETDADDTEETDPTAAIEKTDDPEVADSPATEESEPAADTAAGDDDGALGAVEDAVEASAGAVDDTASSAVDAVDSESEVESGDEEMAVEETVDEAETDEEATAEEVPEEGVTQETETESDAAEEDVAEIDCPGCEETLPADVNFCPSCGEDVSAIEPGEDEELTECPDCGADVGPEDSFCASCGEDLDAHREPDELTECPDCGTDVDPEDSFCVSCGEDLDAHRGATSDVTDESDSEVAETPPADGAASEPDETEPAPEPVPDSLVLDARGEELTVSDGETVGRELRRIITETGGDEDDAVRVHREHVRFEREDSGFYLVDLGRNPTALNGTSLSEGDREPVGPGDELTLSGIITLAVRAP